MEQDTRICSNCKRAINSATFELHESHCQRHIKLCSVCGDPVPLKDMDEHFKDNHAPKPCELCNALVAPDELQDHQEHSCPEAKVECKYCELDIRRSDYPEHVEQCGSRTDFCELCNQRVMLKDMSEHKAMKCGHMKAESALRRSDLHNMGLDSDCESDDDFNLPPGNNLPVAPPPRYEEHREDSVHVDPHWLQTVAEACGEDNLDALLAQNVFFENMRSTRSGDPYVTNRELGSQDGLQTAEESSDSDEIGNSGEQSHAQQLLANRLLERGSNPTKRTAPDGDEDFYLAQRLQEREVMGHSRTLYDEERARDQARKYEREGKQFERGGVSGTIVKQSGDQSDDLVGQQIEEKLSARILEEAALVKRLEEMREREERLNEEKKEVAKQLEEVHSENDSLRLAYELKKKDLAEGHSSLWRKTQKFQPCSDEDDDRFAHELQTTEDKLQQQYEDDQPCHKSLPLSESSEKIPCQWCNKLIPFKQVMLHQQSCYEDYYGGTSSAAGSGRGHECGLHLSEDTFRRVEEEEEDPWRVVEEFNVECQYCGTSVSISYLSTHEALCEANPDIHLKKAYDSQLPSAQRLERHLSPPSSSPAPSFAGAATKLLSVEKGPCEYCHQLIPLSDIIQHEATCVFSQQRHGPATPPSSPTLTSASETHSPYGRRTLAIKFPGEDTRNGVPGSGTTKHFSDHETPRSVVGDPAKKPVESTQLDGVGASKFSTRNYGTPKQDTYHSLSRGKVVCADGGERNVTDGTRSIEKAGNTSLREKQLKSQSKTSTNVDSVRISSRSKPDEKSASSRYYSASRSQSQYATDRAKTMPVASVGAHKPNKSTAKVEAGKSHHRPRVEQTRASKPASSVTRRLDKPKQH